MALQTATYAELKSLVEGLIGTSISPGAEEYRLVSNINMAARMLYLQSSLWPRWVVIGEPRSAKRILTPDNTEKRPERDGIVQSVETGLDAVEVTVSFTTSQSDFQRDAEGVYRCTGLRNGLNEFTHVGADDTYKISYSTDNSRWEITTDDYAIIFAYDSTSSVSITAGSWTINEGNLQTGFGGGVGITSCAVTLSRTHAEIDSFLRVHSAEPFTSSYSCEYDWHPDPSGIKLHGSTFDSIVWVTYRKKFDVKYGPTDTTTIPFEWLNYMAYHAARMYQMSNLSADRVMIGARELQSILELELQKLDRETSIQWLKRSKNYRQSSQQYI